VTSTASQLKLNVFLWGLHYIGATQQ